MNGKRKKHLAASALGSLFLISVLTCVDQLTKYWAESWLKSHSPVTLIQGVLELRYLENRGMDFSLSFSLHPVFYCCPVLLYKTSQNHLLFSHLVYSYSYGGRRAWEFY